MDVPRVHLSDLSWKKKIPLRESSVLQVTEPNSCPYLSEPVPGPLNTFKDIPMRLGGRSKRMVKGLVPYWKNNNTRVPPPNSLTLSLSPLTLHPGNNDIFPTGRRGVPTVCCQRPTVEHPHTRSRVRSRSCISSLILFCFFFLSVIG